VLLQFQQFRRNRPPAQPCHPTCQLSTVKSFRTTKRKKERKKKRHKINIITRNKRASFGLFFYLHYKQKPSHKVQLLPLNCRKSHSSVRMIFFIFIQRFPENPPSFLRGGGGSSCDPLCIANPLPIQRFCE
jgi:hypothetical protein